MKDSDTVLDGDTVKTMAQITAAKDPERKLLAGKLRTFLRNSCNYFAFSRSFLPVRIHFQVVR